MSAAEGYEALRQARIAENMARLRQKHGLLLNAGVLLGEAPQPVRNPAKRRKVAVAALPLRKSDRAKGKQAVCYVVDGEPFRPRMKASCKGSKRTSSSVDRWEPSWAIQTDAAILAATTAAHELTDKINDARGDDLLAFSKVMMYSHVAKGFWLEAPPGLPAALGARDTMMVDLECSNTTVPVADMANRDAEGLWEAKLLMRSNKRAFGFSGGWRGFAKDQRLTMNDTVVFEVPPKTTGSRVGKPKIRLHIFRGEDYETDETRPHVKPAQVVTAGRKLSRKAAKGGTKRALPAAVFKLLLNYPAGSNGASADGSGEEDSLAQAAPTDEPGLDDSSSDGSDASSGADSDSDVGSDPDADAGPSGAKDDAPGSAPTAVDVPARRGSRTRAGEGTDGAAPAAAGAGMEGTVPQRLPAPTGAVASSSQGPTKGQALAAGKVKASRMLPRRTDLGGGSSGGTDASRQAVAPAAGGSKPGGGRQPHSNGQQPRGSGAGKKNQAAAAKKGAGSGQQPRGGGAEKENQAAAANEGAAPGRGADGKVGSAGAGQREGVAGLGEPAGKDTQPRKRAEKRKGVAGLGEPAGKDTQPKKRAPAPKRAAEPVDTTGWYDKVLESCREVGAPDLDQEGYERGLPKCCLKTFLFNVSIEAAEDGTLTFVHPEPPGAWADRLPTTAPILPKAKVSKGKNAAKGKGPVVGAAGSKAAAGKAAAKASAAGTGGAGPSSSRAAGAGSVKAATAAKRADAGDRDVPLPVRPSTAAGAAAGSSAARQQVAARRPVAKRAAGGSPLRRRASQAAAGKAAGAGGSGARRPLAKSAAAGSPLQQRASQAPGGKAAGAGGSGARRPSAKNAAGGSPLRRRASQAAGGKAASAGGSGATGSPAKSSRCVGTAAAEGKAPGKVAAKNKLGVSTATTDRARVKKAKAKKKPQEFLVDCILDSKVEDGVTKFLIHWLGYSDCEDTWEPIECLDGPPESYKWKRAEGPSGTS